MKRELRFLHHSLTTYLIVLGATVSSVDAQSAKVDPVPMIHVSDLFRPHDDPDDHWDLACVYALASEGRVDLRGILIDYPKPERRNDPDVLAVAQMNYITGLSVPVMIGSSRWFGTEEPASLGDKRELRGVRAMLDIMRRSPEPVVINVLGSCRDVALAGRLEPDLFAKKCRAVYLNAGSGTPDPEKAQRLEWNVHLDPEAYTAIFDLPCPIYWMPCFEVVHPKPRDLFQVAEFATFYRFRQGEVLPHLSQGVQNFFSYMFRHGRFVPETQALGEPRPDWLHALESTPEPALAEAISQMDRNMWCTGGFLHAAGLTVTPQGEIVPLEDTDDAVFQFEPIELSCASDAVTRWKKATAPTNRFIFRVRDTEQYPTAMTSALLSLLQKLP